MTCVRNNKFEGSDWNLWYRFWFEVILNARPFWLTLLYNHTPVEHRPSAFGFRRWRFLAWARSSPEQCASRWLWGVHVIFFLAGSILMRCGKFRFDFFVECIPNSIISHQIYQSDAQRSSDHQTNTTTSVSNRATTKKKKKPKIRFATCPFWAPKRIFGATFHTKNEGLQLKNGFKVNGT